MNIMFCKKLFRNVILLAYRTDITDTRLCRLFHHIAKLAGQFKFTFSRHYIYFDLKSISAHTGPCQSAHNTDFILIVDAIHMETLFSKIVLQLILFYMHCGTVSFINFSGCFSADLTQFSLQITHPSFSGVSADTLMHRLISNRKLLCRQTVFLFLFFQQMFFCDMHFLIFGITGHFNQFHTIQQRTRNRMYIVGCRNKQHFG